MSAPATETPAQPAEEAKVQAQPVQQGEVTNFFQLSALSNKKKLVNFDEYKGHVVIVINVASQCGFTPQYKGLEELYQQYKDKGLILLAFPCNGFGSQEPGNDDEIQTFCTKNYGVTFPIFQKIDVNGDNEHPVYHYLKSKKSQLGMKRIKWNFEKFVINKKGEVVERFSSLTKPEDLKKIVEKLLAE